MSEDKRVAVVPEGVMMREVQGEAVLLHLDTGEYFGLDPVATRMWQLISEHRHLDRVRAALVDEFDVTAEQLATDLRAFVDDLVSKRLLTFEALGDH